ncbi:MAG TPA: hypothetical protein VJQ54_00310 [Candidatus Sulfotelmatobacter sp.]|nr:hypothetical protein [Candidatus Sulfotelmatobacter sp.]
MWIDRLVTERSAAVVVTRRFFAAATFSDVGDVAIPAKRGGSLLGMYTEYRFFTMSTHHLNTISDMMEQYAADAVRLAPEFGVRLDYSEHSLEALERILDQLANRFQSSETEPRSEDSTAKELDSISRIWGGYFGETIRQLWGGEWGIETYPGTIAPVISVDIGGAKLFPVMKIYRRLTKGQDENVWRFYETVRARVSGGRKQ